VGEHEEEQGPYCAVFQKPVELNAVVEGVRAATEQRQPS